VLLHWQLRYGLVCPDPVGVGSGVSRFLLQQSYDVVQTAWSEVSISLGHHQGFVPKRLGNILELGAFLPEPTRKRMT
jgi:hypothetical protein